MRRLSRIAAIVAATVLAAVGVLTLPAAAIPVGVNLTSAPSFVGNSNAILGYEFTVADTHGIKIEALGAYDAPQGNPANGGAATNLPQNETVELFNAAGGAAIASVTVNNTAGQAGATQVGYFDFVNLTTPIKLTSGSSYIVVVTVQSEPLGCNGGTCTGSVDPGITFVGGEHCTSSCSISNAATLSFYNTAFNQALYGANIEFNDLPEASSFAIFGTALFGLGFLGFRRRRKGATAACQT